MGIPNIKGNLLLELYNFANTPIDFLRQQFERNGNQFKVSILNRNIICTRNPIWLNHVFVKNQKNYTKDFTMKQIEFILGKGLLTNTGESWLQQRRLIQTAFHKGRLESLAEIMETIIESHITKLQKMPSGTKFLIDKEMLELTATVALETILGEQMNLEMAEVQEKMAELQEFVVKRIQFPPYILLSYLDGTHQKAKQKLHEIDKVLYKVIEKRKVHQLESFNLIALLLNAVDADTGKKMTDKQLRDELITFYFAGHETTAFGLSWAFYELMQHPEVVDKIKAEVSSVMQNGKIGSDGLRKLTYTAAVVNEALRLHPPAYIVSREALEDDLIEGEPIKKGDMIVVSLMDMHKHPDYWENPKQFNPERFLSKDADKEPNFNPFGAGPRICIGKNFALMEITLVLAKMLTALDFKLVPNQTIIPEALITLKPKNRIQLIKN